MELALNVSVVISPWCRWNPSCPHQTCRRRSCTCARLRTTGTRAPAQCLQPSCSASRPALATASLLAPAATVPLTTIGLLPTEHGGGDGGGFETVDHSEINIADDDVHQVSRYSRLLNASGNQDNLSRRYTLRKRDLPGQKHQITIPLGLICPCVRVLTSGFVLLLSGTQYKVLCQMFPEKRHQSTLPRAPFQTGPLHNCLPAAGH
jgi:hypothetical protein